MKIGFLTNVMVQNGMKELKEIAAWGAGNGFEDMEVGPTIELKEQDVEEIREKGEIDISALIYCRNFLTEDKTEAQAHKDNIIRRIELAGKYRISKVICSTGVAPESFDGICFDPRKSLEKSVEFLKVMVEYAEKHNVLLCVENCPLMGNIGFAPFMWTELFERVGSDRLRLAFDPSHFIWQFMDPYQAIGQFGDKIAHVHAKDTEIMEKVLKQTGILYNPRPVHDVFEGWWRYRVPGLGQINWNKIIDCLNQARYQGTISIEHEDPVWQGDLEHVKLGLLKGQKHLRSFL